MIEQRLSAVVNLAMEADMAKSLDFDKVVKIFATMPSLRDCSASSSQSSDTNLRRMRLI
jgi:hypothetical protein